MAFFVDASANVPIKSTSSDSNSETVYASSPPVSQPASSTIASAINNLPTAFFVDTSLSPSVGSTLAVQPPALVSSGLITSAAATNESHTALHAAAFFVDTSPTTIAPPPSLPISTGENFFLEATTKPLSFGENLDLRKTTTIVADPRINDSGQTVVQEVGNVDGDDGVESAAAAAAAMAAAQSALAFVIGQDKAAEDANEFEKRRQRLQEQQMRRREEQEQKRLQIENEQSRKREALKSKQEEEERRRAEDKARRDAIFDQYMKRKMAVDGNSDADFPSGGSSSSSGKPTPSTSQVVLRRRPGASRHPTSRPMSQPPPASSVAHCAQPLSATPGFVGNRASDDNLLDAASGSSLSHSSERLGSNPDVREPIFLPFGPGGVTHRRPQTPERSSHHDVGGTPGQQYQEVNYTGPKLFVKPSQKSNRSIIINAISHCCLAGVVNRDKVEKAIEEINKSTAMQFVILFRDAGMQYRALYTYNPDDMTSSDVLLTKIHGTGPKQLSSKSMERFYKYNCGAKNFTEVTSTKHLTTTIDAVTVVNSVWVKYRLPAATGKRPV
jgi:calmodulin-regulated spectrin-associated protein